MYQTFYELVDIYIILNLLIRPQNQFEYFLSISHTTKLPYTRQFCCSHKKYHGKWAEYSFRLLDIPRIDRKIQVLIIPGNAKYSNAFRHESERPVFSFLSLNLLFFLVLRRKFETRGRIVSNSTTSNGFVFKLDKVSIILFLHWH